MFTGLINEIGEIIKIENGKHSARLTIKANNLFNDIRVGDSIAVNGVCLTVTTYNKNTFTVDVMPETMSLTNIKHLQNKHSVNLEPALRVGDRFGGHIVTGHIDSIGTIKSLLKDDNATRVTINISKDLRKYIIYKGSVAVDGISLTVTDISTDSFQVSIIPLTGMDTTILKKKIGDTVNIECDVIGKYVESMLHNNTDKSEPLINKDFLRSNGFM
ncbi:riboflavin synthase [Vallitalea sediminicola]